MSREPQRRTKALDFFIANTPNTGCMTPKESCAAANTKLTEAMTNIWADPEADIQGILDQCKTDIEAITK